MEESNKTRIAPPARTWIVLNAEGDVAFGPFLWVRVDPGEGTYPVTLRVSDSEDGSGEKVFAEFDGDYWTVKDGDYPDQQRMGWREPRFTTYYRWLGATRVRPKSGRDQTRKDHPMIETI